MERLSPDEMNIILDHVQPRDYGTMTEVIYEGQIPNVGYLIVDGTIDLYKRKKPFKALGVGQLIGVGELMNNHNFRYTAVIHPGTKVCILDRSTIFELLDEFRDDEVKKYFEHDCA
jgi:CRP-like cAMP-binding protein